MYPASYGHPTIASAMIRFRGDLRIIAFALENQTDSPSCTAYLTPEELLMSERRHGIHLCGAASRDIAREQGDAHQHEADGGIGCWIGGLHVKKPEVLLHEPIESERQRNANC